MSKSYYGTLLDHLAEYMIYLSTASSFWFSLNSSYDHEFHLSRRFVMSPHDYECLLVAANLAKFYEQWGFTILKTQWEKFIWGHQFITASNHNTGTFEIDSKTMDLNTYINGVSPKHRVKSHFIWIGVLTVHSPRKFEMQKDSDSQMMVIPPRLNGLLLQQQSLRKVMDPFLWNYILEKGLEVDSSINEDDSVQSLERKSPSSPPPLTVSVAAKTLVRASSLLNDNDMSM